MWEVGSYVASWHKTSAMPGQVGNMVITGHNNIEGSVFRRLPDLRVGDELVVEAAGRPYTYTVDTMFVVQEKGATPEQKRWNGQWIGNFEDERLTLITCYPRMELARLIVIAAGRKLIVPPIPWIPAETRPARRPPLGAHRPRPLPVACAGRRRAPPVLPIPPANGTHVRLHK